MSAEGKDCVPVPLTVFEGLQRWNELGQQNTPDILPVLRWLRDGGWYAAADWVESNQQSYRDAIIQFEFRPES